MRDESKVMVEPKDESTPITCGPDTLKPDDAEDPIAREQDRLAQLIKGTSGYFGAIFAEIEYISQRLTTPGLLRDSAPVRFFALFSKLRDELKKIDAAIGAEIDTTNMADNRKHDIGRLQGLVQNYLERIEAKSAPAEGKLVTLTRKTWASATNIAALKQNAVTSVFVKETVNGRTLTSWVRELDKDEQGMPQLPEDLKDAISMGDKFTVSAKRA